VLIGSTKGVDTTVWFGPAGLAELARSGTNLLLSTLGFALIGAILGIVLRSPVAAIGVGIAYALPVEAILSSTIGGIDRFLPGQLLQVLAAGGEHSLSYATAAVSLGIYGVLAVVVAGTLFARRDVTS
jgi:ABC-2 type transport system permease protein